jgi:hypothetical protein
LPKAVPPASSVKAKPTHGRGPNPVPFRLGFHIAQRE